MPILDTPTPADIIWQNHILRLFWKARGVGAHLTLGGKMFCEETTILLYIHLQSRLAVVFTLNCTAFKSKNY